jgi:hypothetical protein
LNTSVEETHDAIYINWNSAYQNQVEDFNKLPVINSNKKENNIYTANGGCIPQHYLLKMEQGSVMA